MADATRAHVWGNSATYEAYMGRWSHPLAYAFLAWFAAAKGGRWLDVGCGTGALTAAVLDAADPSAVVGIDPSSAFLDAAKARVPDPRARFEIGDARDLPAPSHRYDAVVAGLVLNFVPDPAAAVAEMARVARPGGTVGAYVWDFRGEMQLVRYFWEAATAADPSAAALDPRPHFHACEPEPLAGLFSTAGLDDVAVEAIDLPMAFRDPDDFWLPQKCPVRPSRSAMHPRLTVNASRRCGSGCGSCSPLRRMARSTSSAGRGRSEAQSELPEGLGRSGMSVECRESPARLGRVPLSKPRTLPKPSASES